MTATLTARQQQIWDFLIRYVDDRGYPPTVREIGTLDVGEPELLALAAAAEMSSEHPLAQAVVKTAFERGSAKAAIAAPRGCGGGEFPVLFAAVKILVRAGFHQAINVDRRQQVGPARRSY